MVRILINPLLILHLSSIKPRAVMLRIVKSDMLSFKADELNRV